MKNFAANRTIWHGIFEQRIVDFRFNVFFLRLQLFLILRCRLGADFRLFRFDSFAQLLTTLSPRELFRWFVFKRRTVFWLRATLFGGGLLARVGLPEVLRCVGLDVTGV